MTKVQFHYFSYMYNDKGDIAVEFQPTKQDLRTELRALDYSAAPYIASTMRVKTVEVNGLPGNATVYYTTGMDADGNPTLTFLPTKTEGASIARLSFDKDGMLTRSKDLTTLRGLTVAFTGKVEGMTRAEVVAQAKEHGLQVSRNVSLTTDFLIVGKRPGSKPKDAAQLGVTMLSVPQWKKKLGQ